MQVTAPHPELTPLPGSAARAEAVRGGPGGFDRALRRAQGADGPPGPAAGQVREAAEQLVASALVLPLLSAVREQPLDANLFDGGQAEKIFGQRLDTILADRVVKSARFGVTDAVIRSMQHRADPSALRLYQNRA